MQSFRSFTRCACLQHLLFQFPKAGIREACIAKTVTICHLPTLDPVLRVLPKLLRFIFNEPAERLSLEPHLHYCRQRGEESRPEKGWRKKSRPAPKSASRSGGRAPGTHWSTGVRRRSRRMRPCLILRRATGNSQTSSKIARRLWQHEDGDLQTVDGARRFHSWLGEWRDIAPTIGFL